MSDQSTNEENQDQNSEEGKNWRRNLEQQLATEKAARIESDKRYAFSTVPGLDLSNPTHKFFADKYDGDLTPEAVKSQATAIGLLKDEEAEQNKQVVQGHQQIDAAGDGAQGAEIAGSQEAALNAILNGNFKSQDEYMKAVSDAGFARDQLNG